MKVTQTRDPFASQRRNHEAGLASTETLPEPTRAGGKKFKPSHKRLPGYIVSSTKRLSGSKWAKKYGGHISFSDHVGRWRDLNGRSGIGSYRCKPNHAARAVDLADCWPLLRIGH